MAEGESAGLYRGLNNIIIYNPRERNKKFIIERKWKGSKKDDMK